MEPACSVSEAQIASTAQKELERGFRQMSKIENFSLSRARRKVAKGRAGCPTCFVPSQDATPKAGLRMTGTMQPNDSIGCARDASNTSSARASTEDRRASRFRQMLTSVREKGREA